MIHRMKTIHLQSQIPEALVNHRLDQALAKLFPEYSRSVLQSWVKNGHVKVDGETWRRPRNKVSLHQHIEITAEVQENEIWQGQALPLAIIYEDDSLIIINKPAGLVVHPGAGVPDSTLVNALIHHAPELKHLPRAGLIHRLDKDTTGLLVIAKTLIAHNALIKTLQAREIHREYEAIVNGIVISGGKIDAPIGRHPVHRTRMSVVNQGRSAITHYRVLERFRAHSHLLIKLETGRTHQIRVHLAHINYPIVGDPTYHKRRQAIPANLTSELRAALTQFKRQALHARRLQFIHPITQEKMSFEAPLPSDMQQLLALLREDANAIES